MLEICRLSLAKGYTHFLYGGKLGSRSGSKASFSASFPESVYSAPTVLRFGS